MLLNMPEPVSELADGLPERILGVDAEEPGIIDLLSFSSLRFSLLLKERIISLEPL
jgi:hypothetical protein